MRHRMALALGAVVLAAAMAGAQSRPAFDVASLKPSPGSDGGPPAPGDKIYINLGTARHGMLTLSNTCLADCLRYAYSITNNEQIAGPDWIKFKDVRFDIEAKAPPDTPLPRLREMLQTLLTERFKLEYHTTQKTMSYVALVVGKNGPKIVEGVEGSDASHNSFIPGKIISNRIPMATFVTLLSRFLGETVIDMTGLKGWYAVNLEWTPEPAVTSRAPGSQPDAPVDIAPGPTVFSAIESQLGLKLEHRKGPLDVMVIDHAERVPVGN
ncbi:MAG: TIGR03435 family protein [Bryobacteraceae bacterium]